jgi:hypothetical protein
MRLAAGAAFSPMIFRRGRGLFDGHSISLHGIARSPRRERALLMS